MPSTNFAQTGIRENDVVELTIKIMSSSANANISCLIALSRNLEKDSIIKLNPFLDNEEYSIHTINNQLSHTPLPDLDLHWKCQVFV